MGYSQEYVELRARTMEFAKRIIRLFRALPRSEEARIIGRQLLRSGTSVGANYRAACRARSLADFISKLTIVLEEADESEYWLELPASEKIFARSKLSGLQDECGQLIRIFVASLITAENRKKREAAK